MSTVSIIGAGGMAAAIAGRAAAAGHTVEVIARDPAKAQALAGRLAGATTRTYGSAPAGEVVVLAVPYAAAAAALADHGDALHGKVVVDISNTFAGADDTTLVTPDGTSGAQQIAEALPAGAHLVKAFNTVFGHVLARGGRLDVFVAGDDAAAKASVSAFIDSLGLRPLDVGGLAMAHWLEGAGLLMMGLARSGAGFDIALGATRDVPAATSAADDDVATLEAFVQGGGLSMVDETAVWREAESLPWGGEWRGPDGFARLTREIDAVAELSVRGHEIVRAGDAVELRLDAVFTSRTSGRELPMTVVEHYRVRDGRIHGADAFYRDTQAVNDLVRNG